MRFSTSQFVISLLTLLLLQGCANLETVRDFSNQSAALAAVPQSVDYWAGWGERSKRFDLLLNKLPRKDGVRVEGPVGPDSTLTKEQIASVKSLHAVLSAYMTKLGALADDDLVDVSKQVDGLVENLDKIPGVTDEGEIENAAYGAILKLVKLPLDGYRHYKIKELIIENDDHVQRLTSILSVSTRSVARFVTEERNSVLNWYDQTSRDFPPPANLSGAMQWDRDRREVVGSYNSKAEAIEAYAVAIRKVGEMHHKMAGELSSFNTDSFKRLAAELKSAKSEIEAARKQYKDAFKA